ncbi:MAG: Uncharacterised protein [Methanobacteriota archaeon]|nr:MAG: Uncharacterised protein [Euryarchaeota archaeon]
MYIKSTLFVVRLNALAPGLVGPAPLCERNILPLSSHISFTLFPIRPFNRSIVGMYDSVTGSYLTTPTGVAIQISPEECTYILSIIGLGNPLATLSDSSH